MIASTYLQDRQVAERFSVTRTAIWRWLKSDPTFPRPIALSPGTTRWRLADLEAWEQAKATSHAA